MKRPTPPPGYSLVTMKFLGHDVPLAAIPDDTLKGLQLIFKGLAKGPRIQLKTADGKVVPALIKKRLPYGYIVEANGKTILARKRGERAPHINTQPKKASETTITVEPTEVS